MEDPMNNVELMKQGYQDFADGNVAAVLAIFHPEIEWNECTGFPFVHGDGRYIGPDAVVQKVFAQIPEHYEGFNIDIQELLESGDKVVMVGYYKGIWKATGKEIKANAAHIWTIKDGKITRLFQAVDTAEIVNP
jgi:ketosteroid isomerase-like protein